MSTQTHHGALYCLVSHPLPRSLLPSLLFGKPRRTEVGQGRLPLVVAEGRVDGGPRRPPRVVLPLALATEILLLLPGRRRLCSDTR